MIDYPATCAICTRTFLKNLYGDPELRDCRGGHTVCEECVVESAIVLLDGSVGGATSAYLRALIKERVTADPPYRRGNIILDGATI